MHLTPNVHSSYQRAWTALPESSPGHPTRYQPRLHLHFSSRFPGNRILSGSAGRHPPGPVSWGHTSPEAYVVVGVVRVVVVAIGNPAVVGVVVPTAAPIHTVRALWTEPHCIVDLRLLIVSPCACSCSGGDTEAFDDLPSQAQRVGETYVRQQCLHVSGQLGFRPFTRDPFLFVAPQLPDESPTGTRAECQPVLKDTVPLFSSRLSMPCVRSAFRSAQPRVPRGTARPNTLAWLTTDLGAHKPGSLRRSGRRCPGGGRCDRQPGSRGR